MEKNLKDLMEESRSEAFSQSEVRTMMYQILSAVNHIHEKWYLHRDLKTSNILVRSDGKIAIYQYYRFRVGINVR